MNQGLDRLQILDPFFSTVHLICSLFYDKKSNLLSRSISGCPREQEKII